MVLACLIGHINPAIPQIPVAESGHEVGGTEMYYKISRNRGWVWENRQAREHLLDKVKPWVPSPPQNSMLEWGELVYKMSRPHHQLLAIRAYD